MNVVLLLLVPVLLFFIINFLLGQFIGRIMHLSYKDTVSLSLTTLARNSPVALAIAVTAFPDEPLIALALVIGPLIELPVLAFVSQVLLLIKKKTAIRIIKNRPILGRFLLWKRLHTTLASYLSIQMKLPKLQT